MRTTILTVAAAGVLGLSAVAVAGPALAAAGAEGRGRHRHLARRPPQSRPCPAW